jgi:hypothetical protein
MTKMLYIDVSAHAVAGQFLQMTRINASLVCSALVSWKTRTFSVVLQKCHPDNHPDEGTVVVEWRQEDTLCCKHETCAIPTMPVGAANCLASQILETAGTVHLPVMLHQ